MRKCEKPTANRRRNEFFSEAYGTSYILGTQVMRIGRRVRQALGRAARLAGRWLYRGLDFLLLRHLRTVGREIIRFFGGFALAGKRVKVGFSRSFGSGLVSVLQLPVCGIRRHAPALKSLCNVALPLVAAVGLIYTIQYWVNCRYVMEVEYQNSSLGYIDRVDVFTRGAALAADRIVSTEIEDTTEESDTPASTTPLVGTIQKNSVPTLRLTANSTAALMDVNTVCDRILKTAGDTISQLSGVYIDGHFEGALESRETLDDLLDGILKNYSDGSANERAEFVQDVEVVDGLYPTSTKISPVDLKKRLTAQTIVDKYYEVQEGNTMKGIARKHDMTLSELLALNPQVKDAESIHIGDKLMIQRAQPYLQVQVVRTITYEEEIPYKTTKVKDSSKYVTYEYVRSSGKNGVQKVTAEVVLLDGVEQSRKVISTKVTKQPTDRVVVVGTKEINPNASAGEATGRLIWPVPGYSLITSEYGERESVRGYRAHKGIDISGGGIYGASIVAADGGRVIEAGYHWSYGYYIRIDHGGGLITMYEHCSKLLVSRGDSVKQGEVIAKVGSSGYSTGAHLHFQVEQSGNIVSPWKYVSKP
ncbi:MAG: M23 family metallopeptidase [Clostridia bacterium]|nr:M23 family metallopeptidase [Clostridia bacterium]